MILNLSFYALRVAAAVLCISLLGFGALHASSEQTSLPKPIGDVLLTIKGGPISNTGDVAVLDRAILEQLPQVKIVTSTIWTEGELEFTGPTLASVLQLVGGSEMAVTATALNNYSVTISPDLITAEAPIIAHRLNGEPFGVRQNGPLWIIFPYDSDEKFRSEPTYAASIWQLALITLSAK